MVETEYTGKKWQTWVPDGSFGLAKWFNQLGSGIEFRSGGGGEPASPSASIAPLACAFSLSLSNNEINKILKKNGRPISSHTVSQIKGQQNDCVMPYCIEVMKSSSRHLPFIIDTQVKTVLTSKSTSLFCVI